MCSESLPKEFEKTSEVLPFNKYGLSSIEEFKNAEERVHHQEWLTRAGLTCDEIKLLKDHEAGNSENRNKIESSVMKEKLDAIYNKINHLTTVSKSSADGNGKPTTSKPDDILQRLLKKPLTFFPEGHPMNDLKNIEETLFGHLKNDIMPITKRRKILRRIERKKQRILSEEKQLNISAIPNTSRVERPRSLWDMKEITLRLKPKETQPCNEKQIIGPKKLTMYTIKDDKIVRLQPMNQEQHQDQYQAVDIVVPVNAAEADMLEGTKMCVDDIRKMERFKEYAPGTPSKVLYLKNIASSVSQEQLSLLFNQFLLANGGPVDLRLMSGRMRGQAFVAFENVDLAIQALEETNGTIMGGRPIIVEFGRNTNRIQDNHR